MIKHLSIRIAWHDNKWNGAVCNHPSKNAYCTHLSRIYDEKNDAAEEAIKGITWSKLEPKQLPPCKAEGGGFMSRTKFSREFRHPHNKSKNSTNPHRVLQPTVHEIPPFCATAVPFWWMLSKNLDEIRTLYPDIPRDQAPNFNTAWVYTKETQNALLNKFFDPVKENNSLAILYIKGPNPLDEDSRRLIAGIGLIKKKSGILTYTTTADYTYPIWDRLLAHGIRMDENESEGILLPYHEYLELPEDFTIRTKDGKKGKYELIDEIKLTLQETASREEVIDEFTYGSSWVNDSSVLVVLGKLRSIIERIKEHGIVRGYWDNHLLWIDRQLGKVKEGMGPFPSFANALIALGFLYGHALEDDMRKQGKLTPKGDPWETWEEVIFGRINLGNRVYQGDLPHFRDMWLNESEERKSLLKLLSRFELTDRQIKNWFDPALRKKFAYEVNDAHVLENPYIMAEDDPGDKEHYPIAVETIDSGLFVDRAIQGDYLPVKPQAVESPLDTRRIRAIIVNILKRAASNGDTLLSVQEITETLNGLNLQRPTSVPLNYISTNLAFLQHKLDWFPLNGTAALQLKQYAIIETYFRRTFLARAKKELDPINENWAKLIKETIAANRIVFDPQDKRHVAALSDQVAALTQITNRKLSILHGPAGTGKTTVMGALFRCKELTKDGILLLAPTGKARVKLGKMAGSDAYTIAQFLNRQKRFDWVHMKPLFYGAEKYQGEQNVIIDECSMLTEDDLYALLQALDMGHVKRIILVGDPYQLPPIGAGRPFADLCSHLELLQEDESDYSAAKCLARLKEVVRTVEGEHSDTLTLASWYSGIKPSKNADVIFSKLGDNNLMNDLQVLCWQDEEELIDKLNGALIKVLNLNGRTDYSNLNKFLGIDGGKIDTGKIERFQLLSPVKAPYWGAFNLNRKFQQQFRGGLKDAANIGDYQIGLYDKVIQTVNEWKEGFPGGEKHQLSNGQLGLVQSLSFPYANVVFAGVEKEVTFGYKSKGQMDTDGANLELAYAITVHKSQGSDFDFVFLVVPKTGRINSRELIYTALTRAKKKLILLVEGDSPHWIINLSKPQYSETAKRNTHVFRPSVRLEKSSIPFAEGLIHKTKKEGLLVRSKSEVIIANMLIEKNIEFDYEKQYIGKNGEKRLPDFTFVDAAGDSIMLEHLGMLEIPSYESDWKKKLKFYEENMFKLNENLFTTTETEKGGIDSIAIEQVITNIQQYL
jgi:ATP-dependent exoDNAse (exonuclease V) alpha subunit